MTSYKLKFIYILFKRKKDENPLFVKSCLYQINILTGGSFVLYSNLYFFNGFDVYALNNVHVILELKIYYHHAVLAGVSLR